MLLSGSSSIARFNSFSAPILSLSQIHVIKPTAAWASARLSSSSNALRAAALPCGSVACDGMYVTMPRSMKQYARPA